MFVGRLMLMLSLIEKALCMLQGKGFGVGFIRAEVRQALKLLGRRPLLIVDIGGNIGDYTLQVLKRCPGVEVHIFEPSKKNSVLLTARFEEFHGIKIVNKAVSNYNGESRLYSNFDGSPLASLIKRDVSDVGLSFDFSDRTQVIRFEEYWKQELGGRSIDIVKLDIEGVELSALEGFGEAMNYIDVIQFEFGGCNIDSRTNLRDFFKFFDLHAFYIYIMTPFGPHKLGSYQNHYENYRTTNYFAVRRVAATAPSRPNIHG